MFQVIFNVIQAGQSFFPMRSQACLALVHPGEQEEDSSNPKLTCSHPLPAPCTTVKTLFCHKPAERCTCVCANTCVCKHKRLRCSYMQGHVPAGAITGRRCCPPAAPCFSWTLLQSTSAAKAPPALLLVPMPECISLSSGESGTN